MCGRFTQKSERRIIGEEFYVREFSDEIIVSYNLAPGQNAGVIINEGINRYVRFKWGLVPSWADDPKIGYRMINARAETVTEKPSFRKAFTKRRCLIPADGFYEWKKCDKYKVPFYIYHNLEKPLGFAGLWEKWVSQDGRPLFTFTIITTKANNQLREIHDRMPVIIPKDKRELWLQPEVAAGAELFPLLEPYRYEDLVYHEVSRMVNSPKNNSPECLKPVSSGLA